MDVHVRVRPRFRVPGTSSIMHDTYVCTDKQYGEVVYDKIKPTLPTDHHPHFLPSSLLLEFHNFQSLYHSVKDKSKQNSRTESQSPFRPFFTVTEHCLFLTEHCFFLTQHCFFLTQHCLFLTQHCLFLTQHCLFLTQHCLFLTKHCLFLTKYCLVMSSRWFDQLLSRTLFLLFNTRRLRAVCLSVCLSVCRTCGQRGPRSRRATENNVLSHVLRTNNKFCFLLR